MPDRGDAHIHLFAHSYGGGSFTSRPGVAIDEAVCYESLAESHAIRAALTVGYEGKPWARDNNRHIAALAKRYAWVHPVAYVDPRQPPTQCDLEAWQAERFVGLSFYLFDDADTRALAAMHDDVWQWLVKHRWLISVNARGHHWRCWQAVLERRPQLSLLISHLGLPPRVSTPPADAEADTALSCVLDLATFPAVHVKLSGFYAITDPGHDYPHEPAWPYVQALIRGFGSDRCLWGSDFTPHLNSVSFPQTLDLFSHMSFLPEEDRTRIEGANLLSLLAQVER